MTPTDLMQGVTILAQNECKYGMPLGLAIPLLVVGLLGIIGVIVWVTFDPWEGVVQEASAIVAAAILIIGLLGVAYKRYHRTEYKVTIDKSVSLIEFNERYEIIDQDGVIYTVIERGDKQ